MNFIHCRIAPLQHRGGRRAWEYKNPADTMRLYTGLNNNLTVMEHYCLIRQLFNRGCVFHLSVKVIPLCNNTAKNYILARMPECDTKGVVDKWKVPTKIEIKEWLPALKEEVIIVEDDMVHPTKNDEAKFLQARIEEAKKVACPWEKAKDAGKGKSCGAH